MISRTIGALTCVGLLLSGCASTGGPGGLSNPLSSSTQTDWSPSIDMSGVNATKYAQDLSDCRAYAVANPDTDKGEQAKNNAIKGGLIGAGLIGVAVVATGGLALLPAAAGLAATTGGIGAAGGAVGGSMIADGKYKKTVNKCLTGRGYKVIG